jgi:hypothetical protein
VYGRNFNYVPLTSFDTIAELARQQLGYLVNIETHYLKLQDSARAQGERIQALRAAADQLRNHLQAADEQNASLSTRAGELQDEVRSLFFELEALHQRLMSAEGSFKRAVRRRDNCVSFENVLKFGALVATVVATAGAGAAAWASAATALNGLRDMQSLTAQNATWTNIKADYNRIADIVKPAGRDVSAFASAFGEAEAAYRNLFPERPQIPGVLDQSEDAVRLVAAKADFDKAIEPYLKLPEAREYKAIMHRYIATAETRNNKILEHDRAVTEIVQIAARAMFERITVSRLTATTAANFDARLSENLAFLTTSLSSLKWQLVRQLVSMEKSLEYMTGQASRTAYADFSVAALQVTAAALLARYAQTLETFGQEAQFGQRFVVPLADLLAPEDIERFVSGKTVTFALNEIEDDLFGNQYAVQTGRIGFVSERGAVISGNLNVSIQHLGRSVVRQRDGSSSVFTHVPVTASYLQNFFGEISSRGDLLETRPGGRSRYVGVSPYGPWRIRLNSASADARTALRQAVLTLDVYFRTMPIRAEPRVAAFSSSGMVAGAGLLAQASAAA